MEEDSLINSETGAATLRSVTYLVHFLQTLISNFQPVNHFLFNLSKLQILHLEKVKNERLWRHCCGSVLHIRGTL